MEIRHPTLGTRLRGLSIPSELGEWQTSPLPPVKERSFTVPPDGANCAIRVTGHTFISIFRGDDRVAHDMSQGLEISFRLRPGQYSLRTDGIVERIEMRRREDIELPSAAHFLKNSTGGAILQKAEQHLTAVLRLTVQAPSYHPVDGVAEIPADGKSGCTIVVERHDLSGNIPDQAREGAVLFLRTTGGRLVSSSGDQTLRTVQLHDGKTAFRLIADEQPKIVTVTVLGDGVTPARAEIEFIPPDTTTEQDEKKELSEKG